MITLEEIHKTFKLFNLKPVEYNNNMVITDISDEEIDILFLNKKSKKSIYNSIKWYNRVFNWFFIIHFFKLFKKLPANYYSSCCNSHFFEKNLSLKEKIEFLKIIYREQNNNTLIFCNRFHEKWEHIVIRNKYSKESTCSKILPQKTDKYYYIPECNELIEKQLDIEFLRFPYYITSCSKNRILKLKYIGYNILQIVDTITIEQLFNNTVPVDNSDLLYGDEKFTFKKFIPSKLF